jgi:glycosyltransferase involved in cell wall biosynthesis
LTNPDLKVEPILQILNNDNVNFKIISPELNEMVKNGKIQPGKKLINLSNLNYECDHFDLVHFTYYLPTSKLLNRSFPKISTIHDFIPESIYPFYSINRRLHFFKKTYLVKSDGLIFVSNDALDSFNRLYPKLSVGCKKVIHHGVEVHYDQLHKEFNYGKDYFLYVGNRSGYKNFSLALEAFAKIALRHNVDLICFGGGPLLSSEKRVIYELGLTNRVKFYSDKQKKLIDLFGGAKAFINPSILEGFGLTNLEALSCGCPVICTDTKIFKEVLGVNAFYFASRSSDSLANVMDNVLSQNLKLDLKMAKSHLKKYSWLETAIQTSDFYHYTFSNFNN